MLIQPVRLGDPDVVRAWFTGRAPGEASPVGAAGNLAHRRPHRPSELARDRATVGERTGTDPASWQLMQQVHGTRVAAVRPSTPPGLEHPETDALVTAEPDRPLVVQTADCLPLLMAGPRTVGAVHAGRRGVVAGVVPATLEVIAGLGDEPRSLQVTIGPSIGACCYEVPAELWSAVTDRLPSAAATTSWGTPSLDLKAAVRAQLRAAGVERVDDVGVCTRCDPAFFSHRRDPASGRQVGLILRRATVPA